jgi:hypothetical protein
MILKKIRKKRLFYEFKNYLIIWQIVKTTTFPILANSGNFMSIIFISESAKHVTGINKINFSGKK